MLSICFSVQYLCGRQPSGNGRIAVAEHAVSFSAGHHTSKSEVI